MLDYAIKYEDNLKQKFMSIVGTERFKYYQTGYTSFDLSLNLDDWNYIEMVSVSNNNINGFLSAYIDRYVNAVSELSLISFENDNFILGLDLYKFLKMLRKRFDKINFSVNCGNPVESKYDKLVNRCGGRIVGIYKNHVRLTNGELCDKKIYEILK